MSQPLSPGSVLGILGGGQLGRMMSMAAAELGYQVHIYAPEKNSPAAAVSPHTTYAQFDDTAALARFAENCDAVTYEFENIPAAAAETIERAGTDVWPSPHVLRTCQHRLREKEALCAFGVPVAPYAPVHTLADCASALAITGLPVILKTAESGYDGKGQAKVETLEALYAAFGRFGQVPCVLEGLIDFTMEFSVVVLRDAYGTSACYDPVQNIHRDHILHETIAPAPISPALAIEAKRLALAIAAGLDLRGLLAIELFLTRDGALLVNELAPRPHNSGHWTLQACHHSQFENAARAVLGLPLGTTARHSDATMRNLIGAEADAWLDYARDPLACLHLYGKGESRPGRKMGHVTWLRPRTDD